MALGFEHYEQLSIAVRGFTRGCEAAELYRCAYEIPPPASIVEIGTFLGSSTILLAGALKERGSGLCHCVDPFDGSGDAFSRPYYAPHFGRGQPPLLDQFLRNIAGIDNYVQLHMGFAQEVGRSWDIPIDLLFMDGDQSPEAVRAAWDLFSPHLRSGAVVAMHNAELTNHRPTHDGHRIVASKELVPPRFINRRWIGTTCYATMV